VKGNAVDKALLRKAEKIAEEERREYLRRFPGARMSKDRWTWRVYAVYGRLEQEILAEEEAI